MGVAYYANYFVWFEVARCELLRTVGGNYRKMEQDGIFLPVIQANCRFLQPARYDDKLTVLTRGRIHSPVRVEFTYELRRSQDELVLATGETLHAATGQTGRPSRLPENIRAMLS